jgi:hypothetical protein
MPTKMRQLALENHFFQMNHSLVNTKATSISIRPKPFGPFGNQSKSKLAKQFKTYCANMTSVLPVPSSTTTKIQHLA